MESSFFTYLLTFLRKNAIQAHYSLPIKCTYPHACHTFLQQRV